MKLAFVLLAASVATFNLWLCLKSLLYNKLIFRRFHCHKYKDDFTPRVAVFVPCKGAENNLRNHLLAIANQDYPNYKVKFIVDNINDPAAEIIRPITKEYLHTKLLVSGKAKKCGQKNHNLLYGIKDDCNESEVYVFADSDVRPHLSWLKELIRPLSLESVPVTTGFRWLIPENRSLSEAIHSMMSAYLCILISHQLFRGVWGGSTAIKKEVFEQLKVRELWETAIVDDMSLTTLLFKKRINRVFVPTCLTVSYNTLPRLKDDVIWYSRQAAFLKTYLKPLWIACIILHFITTFILIMAPIYTFLSLFNQLYYDYAIVSIIFSFFNMFSYGMMKFTYRDNQKFIYWFLIAPIMQVLGFYSLIKPGFSNNIRWRNIDYELYNDGSVKSIQEITNALEIV